MDDGWAGEQTKDASKPPSQKETREVVDFTGPVDSVYLDAPGYVELDVGTGASSGLQGPCDHAPMTAPATRLREANATKSYSADMSARSLPCHLRHA